MYTFYDGSVKPSGTYLICHGHGFDMAPFSFYIRNRPRCHSITIIIGNIHVDVVVASKVNNIELEH
jgi:hypothetical protein